MILLGPSIDDDDEAMTVRMEGGADETRVWRSRQRRSQFLDSAQNAVVSAFLRHFRMIFWFPG